MPSFSRILAVDLGASAVRMVEIGPDAKGRPTVLALSEEDVAFDPAKTSDLFPLYAQALGAAWARLSSKTRRCHLCLGGPAVFARILKVPAADPAKVRSMIGFEAQQTVPAIEQAWWDYQLLPSSESGEVEALILAIKRETVQEMCAAATSVGLVPEGVTVAPAALLNAFLFNHPESPGCQLILEIGARATTILLVEGPRVFVRVVPLGGAALTQAVATDLQESFAGAEVLKRAKAFVHPGGAYEDPVDGATARISKLARGVMTRIHTEVERSVTFFRSQQGGGKPSQAWLAGGGAMLGLSELFFREKLRIPVEYLQPFRRLALPRGTPAESATRQFPSWGTAVGAALQALPDAPVRVDVSGERRASHPQKKFELGATVAGLVAGVVLLGFPGMHSWWLSAKEAERLSLETGRVEEAARALQTLESANQKFLVTTREMEAALALQEERLRWPGLLEELRIQTPRKLWITSLRVLPVPEVAPVGDRATKPGPAPSRVVEISGMFETQSERADAEAVANFQKALEKGGVLQNVAVLERETPRYVDGKTDQVALKFRLKADWPISLLRKDSASEGAPR